MRGSKKGMERSNLIAEVKLTDQVCFLSTTVISSPRTTGELRKVRIRKVKKRKRVATTGTEIRACMSIRQMVKPELKNRFLSEGFVLRQLWLHE